MPKNAAKVGDKIEVAQHHRLAGSEGTIVAIGDNPHALNPIENFHVRFDRITRGVCNRREIWLNATDFVVTEKAPAGYTPPDDIITAAPDTGDQ